MEKPEKKTIVTINKADVENTLPTIDDAPITEKDYLNLKPFKNFQISDTSLLRPAEKKINLILKTSMNLTTSNLLHLLTHYLQSNFKNKDLPHNRTLQWLDHNYQKICLEW